MHIRVTNNMLIEMSITLLTNRHGLYREPEWESFAKDRQKWEKPFEGTVQYKGKSKGEKMPDSI